MSSNPEVSISVGQHLTGRVYAVRSNKILVHLPGGYHGIVRQREMSWEDNQPDPSTLVQVNQTYEFVVTKVDEQGKNTELSLRYVQRDPWDGISDRYTVGQDIEGVIYNVRSFGAFVQVEGGVNAFIPVSQIRADERLAIAQEALWVGDQVRARITQLDARERRMNLSIKEYVQDRARRRHDEDADREHLLIEMLDDLTHYRLRQAMGDMPDVEDWPEPGRIRRIVVADDHADFRTSLTGYLRDLGYVVTEVQAAQELIALSQSQPYDLLIIDMMLGGSPSVDVAIQLAQQDPDLGVLLLSSSAVDEQRIIQAQSQRFIVDYKPLGSKALADHLHNFEQERVNSGAASRTHVEQPLVEGGGFYDLEIRSWIEDAIRQHQAESGGIFRISLDRPNWIDWLYPVNLDLPDKAEVHGNLRISPAGDILYERQAILIEDVSRNPRQSMYLTSVVPFQSLAGIPVEVPGREQPYAIILFSAERQRFNQETLTQLAENSVTLASLLYRHEIFATLLNAQQELLNSRLIAGALHDVGNELSTQIVKFDRLEMRSHEMMDRIGTRQTLAEMDAMINEQRAVLEQMRSTINMVRLLSHREGTEEVQINDLLRQIFERLQPLARYYGAQMNFYADHNLPSVQVNPTHLQHAIENVLLNAVQWTALRRLRMVELSSHYTPDDQQHPVKIRVSDTGPGIHYQLQEKRIFELGYSTRPQGSGLGLFIVQTLVESMQGIVRVERSVIEVGTSFVIGLPLKLQ